MRLGRWLLIPLAFALLVAALPAYAQTDPPVLDKGRNIYDVDVRRGDLPDLLPAEEVERLKTIQGQSGFLQLLSPISPDDQAVLAVVRRQLVFLNIQDGSLLPIPVQRLLQGGLPLSLLQPAIGFAWLDDRTLVMPGLTQGRDGSVVLTLIGVDRVTGEVGSVVLPNTPERALPFSIAPNARYLVLAQQPEPPAEAAARPALPQVFKLQVGWPRAVPLANGAQATRSALPEDLRQQLELAAGRIPGLENFLALGRLQNEQGQVAVVEQETRVIAYDTENGQQRELRRLPLGTQPIAYTWSQDGSKFALSLTRFFDYDRVPTEREGKLPFDGAILAEQVYRDATGNLPPAENPILQNNTVETFEMGTGATKVLRAAEGDGAFLYANSWSTDGQTLLVQSLYPGRLKGRTHPSYSFQFVERGGFRFYNAALQPIGRFEPPQLAAPFSDGVFVSPDEVIISAYLGTDLHPYYYNRVSGEFRNIAKRAGTYAGVRATRLSRQIVFNYTSFTDPPDFYRQGWDGTSLSRLTWVHEELRQFSKTRQDPVSFTLRNGQVRRGVLIQPADAPFPPRNQRIVVWQEGGPGGVMQNQWLWLAESPFALLPNFGFGLLVVPLSGRYGYDASVYNALYDRNNFGQIDIDEQAEIVRQMFSRGYTAQGKVGIVGCSYGGYFVLQSLVRHPSLYSAAHDQCSLVDAIVEWNRGYPALMPYIQGLPPWNALPEYQRDSPIYNANRITTPLLSFHGTEDFLPVALNVNMHLQLVNRNQTARLLTFARAGHGLVSIIPPDPSNPDPRLQNAALKYELYGAQEQIVWFRRYLK